MRTPPISFLIILLVCIAAPQQQRSSDATPNFSGVYELVSVKGNMYPKGLPQRRLEVTQTDAEMHVVRIEGEKRWVRTFPLNGEEAENSPTPSSRERDKALFKGDQLTVDTVHLVPPDFKSGYRETEIWQFVDRGTHLKIDRHVEFAIPGVSVEAKKATELYAPVRTAPNPH